MTDQNSNEEKLLSQIVEEVDLCIVAEETEDDFDLSQIAEETEDDFDLSQIADETEDDFDLSQIALKIENEMDTPISSLSLTQTMANYKVEPQDFLNFDIGNFNLLGDKNINNFLDANVDNIDNIEIKNESRPVDSTPTPRFPKPVSEEDIECMISDQKNPNTTKNTKWALGIFNEWRISRATVTGQKIPELQLLLPVAMDFWLQRFVMEVRKKNGEEYPPKSLYFIICGLLRHLRDLKIHDINFLDEKDVRFGNFRRVLDARMKELLGKGLGTKIKKADPLTPDDEDKLWLMGVFGEENAVSLQHTVFFYACKIFGLRGRDEHRQLDCSQFEIGEDKKGKYIRFIGRANKTYKGGLGQIGLTNKDIKHYSDGGHRCIVSIFEKYLKAVGNAGDFYKKPLPGNAIRYGKQLVGVNKLDGFMKEICSKGGLKGNYTNHSGKRTCATQLYRAGIDEQDIMGRTGHRSTAVRQYKTPNENVQHKVSSVLNPPSEYEPPQKQSKVSKEITTNNTFKCDHVKPMLLPLNDVTNTSFLTEVTDRKGIVNFTNCNFNFK